MKQEVSYFLSAWFARAEAQRIGAFGAPVEKNPMPATAPSFSLRILPEARIPSGRRARFE